MPTKEESKKSKSGSKYFEDKGRRKTAVARVRIFTGEKVEVNGQSLAEYFPLKKLQETVTAPFKITGFSEKMGASVKVSGGGVSAQAEAARHGISRSLVAMDPELRKPLKAAGFLKRDPRMVERKKAGLKKARRAPKWRKR